MRSDFFKLVEFFKLVPVIFGFPQGINSEYDDA